MTSRSDGDERAWRARESGRIGVGLGLFSAQDLGVAAIRGQLFGSWIWAYAVMGLIFVASLIMLVRGLCAADDLGRKPDATARVLLVFFGLIWVLKCIQKGVHGLGAEALVHGASSALAFACAVGMWRRARRSCAEGEVLC